MPHIKLMFTTRIQTKITQHNRNKSDLFGRKMVINKEKTQYDPAIGIGQQFLKQLL